MTTPVVLLDRGSLGSETVTSRDHEASVAAALDAGFAPIDLPPFWSLGGTLDELLDAIEPHPGPTPGIWLGYIPEPATYRTVHEAARQRGIHLLNAPEPHLELMEFDRFYPLLDGLTPRSVTIRDGAPLDEAAIEALGWPVFVKGALQSLKSHGLSSCLASSMDELHALTATLRGHKLSRGRVIVREWVTLRHAGRRPGGLPQGREFRVFLLRGQVMGCGYYWGDGLEDGNEMTLDASSRHEVESLACAAARRLSAPLVAVDVGQLTDGRWIVIEVGDPQFAGAGRIDLVAYYRRLLAAL